LNAVLQYTCLNVESQLCTTEVKTFGLGDNVFSRYPVYVCIVTRVICTFSMTALQQYVIQIIFAQRQHGKNQDYRLELFSLILKHGLSELLKIETGGRQDS